MLDAATLRVIGAEKQPPDARKRNRLGTHGAWLQCDIQIAVGKPCFRQFPRRHPDRQQLRMRGWIMVLLDTVPRHGDDPRRPPINNHGAHGHVPGRRRLPGRDEGLLHIPCIFHGADGARESTKLQRCANSAPNDNDARTQVNCGGARAPRRVRGMTKPVIGITLDSEEPGSYSNMPWYALRQNYADAVVEAGGIPLPLPHEPDQAEDYLDIIDGLVITGGAFDVDPSIFGAGERHPTVVTKDRRTAFELATTRGALDRDMPLLGICGGQQLLHVALGGTLIQHIPDEVPDALAHEQPNPRDEPGHSVSVLPGTLLHRIVHADSLDVNSAHHQAAKDASDRIIINAVAPDGVIEGIEAIDKRFCLGVQWHPEYKVSAGDGAIFQAFIDACGH